jgi:hypothetical protein
VESDDTNRDPGREATRRGALAADRAAELRKRREELAEAKQVTNLDVDEAVDRVKRATARAEAALRAAIAGHLRAAEAHDAAAASHESRGHIAEAKAHREAARAARHVAERVRAEKGDADPLA